MKIYIDISNDLYAGVWKATHFFQSIGYPLLLATLREKVTHLAFTMSLLQGLASIVTLFIFHQLAAGSLGRKIGLISLLIGTFHYPWILFGNFALPESIFTLFLAIAAWCAWKITVSEEPAITYSVLWGIAFISAFWLKGTHALWGPLFLLALLLAKQKRSYPIILVICTIVTLGLGLHGHLSYQKIGKIQLSASTSGLNFIEGKCPEKVNEDSNGYRWQSPLYYQLELNSVKRWGIPFTESSYFMKEGLKCIQKDPLVLITSLESIPYLFMGNTMWPFNRKPYSRLTRLYELIFAFFLVSGLSAYTVYAFKEGVPIQEFTTWVIPLLSLFLCVYLFKSEMRYRVPFDIWFIPVALKGWQSMVRFI